MKLKSIVILFGILLLILTGCSNTKEEFPLVIDLAAEPIPESHLDEETIPKMVAIPGWNSISIPDGYSEVYMDFYNPDANTDMYNLTFEWRLLNDSEQGYEVIYQSGIIKPGEHTEKIELSRSFEIGEYETVIFVQPYKISDNSPTNNANMNTKLIVR